ncbi:HNH endonuclease signature motif containing protein [Pseudomonas nitroreducens]|nr:HNH endonuclease signature motif containing protein [Pseudomonas nitroreducens]
MTRPAIPKEIERAVLIEAGHQCAIPACRHPRVEIHHIIPWAKCKKHEYRNLIALCPNCHTRVHDGEIDRKSLLIYKSALASAIRDLGESAFSQYPIVEIKRHIYDIRIDQPETFFDFEFPDFCNTDLIIASKNIEAWGNELLEWHNSQADNNKEEAITCGYIRGTHLTGRYEISRRDASVLSVRYTIQGYLGGAHGYKETRVQNFLLSPFSPLTIDYLVINEESLTTLSTLIRHKFEKDFPDFHGEWLQSGTTTEALASTPFLVERYGISFAFAEYQVGGYAQGSPEIFLSFDELDDIVKPEILSQLSDY